MPNIAELDTPDGLVLSDVERLIVEALASRKSAKVISQDMGIPTAAINNLMRKPAVTEFIAEVIDARNQLLKLHIVDTLSSIFDDKIDKNYEDEDARMADLTRKDVVDVAKTINDLIKTSDSTKADAPEDRMTQIYNQISVIQQGDK